MQGSPKVCYNIKLWENTIPLLKVLKTFPVNWETPAASGWSVTIPKYAEIPKSKGGGWGAVLSSMCLACLVKGIVHPKVKLMSLITQPRVVPNP